MSNENCLNGIYDCNYELTTTCTSYNNNYINLEGREWIVVISSLVMCIMAFGVGANDAANSWGTSVGSGAIPLNYALYLAGFFELLGAVTLGHGVSAKLQEGVSEITNKNCWACGYCNSKISVYDVGMLGSLISAAIFLLLATSTSLPVSTTHAIVGAIIGMTISSIGITCVEWGFDGVGGIFASWVISPLLSGILAILLYRCSIYFVFNSKNPTSRIIFALPWIFSIVTFVMLLLILTKSPLSHSLAIEFIVLISFVSSMFIFLGIYFFVVPKIQNTFPSKLTDTTTHSTELSPMPNDIQSNSNNDNNPERNSKSQTESNDFSLSIHATYTSYDWNQADARYCFRYLLLFNAALLSFAHGANDTANSTAAFSAIYSIYKKGTRSCDDIGNQEEWVLVLAGVFVYLGIVLYGKNVIVTIGEKLSDIDYCKGFCIQFATCLSVLIASYAGFPVSTTHCQVGAIIAIGYDTGGKDNVHWKEVVPIIGAWVLTVPFSGLLSAALTSMFKLGL